MVDVGVDRQLARRGQLIAGLEAPAVDRVDEVVRELASDAAVLGTIESREGRQIKFV